MSKNLSAKHYQKNEERLQKSFLDMKIYLKKKKTIYICIYIYIFHFLLMFAQQIKNLILRLCKFNFGKLFLREQFFWKVF